MQIAFSDQYFYNCIFYKNQALSGAAIGIATNSYANVYNSIFHGNVDNSSKEKILGPNNQTHLKISHCISQSPIQFADRDSMIFTVPLFVDLAQNDFRLDRRSPGINKRTLSVDAYTEDFNQESRVLDSLDIGIYEFQISDSDLDMYFYDEDCAINDPNINPGQIEEPYNNNDDDCNTQTLDDDLDQDGFLVIDDCDDTNSAINPDAVDIPGKGIDEERDGMDITSNTANQKIIDFEIYPNPSSSLIKLSTLVTNGSYCIFDINGRKIMCQTLESQIDISSLENAMYIITLFEIGEYRGKSRFIKSSKH